MTPTNPALWLIAFTAAGMALPLAVMARELGPRVMAFLQARAAERAADRLVATLAAVSDDTRAVLTLQAAADAGLDASALAALVLAVELPGRKSPASSHEPHGLLLKALRALDSGDAEVTSAHSRKLYGDESRIVLALAGLLSDLLRRGTVAIETTDTERSDIPYVTYLMTVRSAGAIPSLAVALLRRVASAHRGRVDAAFGAGTAGVALSLPAAMSPSRLKPQCHKAPVEAVSAALGLAAGPVTASGAESLSPLKSLSKMALS